MGEVEKCPKYGTENNLMVVSKRNTIGALVIHFIYMSCGHDFERYFVKPVTIWGDK